MRPTGGAGWPGHRLFVAGWATAMVFDLVGCADLHPTRSGFLDHYERLTPTSDRISWGGGNHRIEVALPAPGDMQSVDSFYIEPVHWLATENDWMGPNPGRRSSVSNALEGALRDKLGQIRPIVDKPGPKTATVRATVTDVAATRAVTKLIVSTTTWHSVSNGGATVEAEVLAPDGHRIAAVDGASMGGFLDYFGHYLWSSHSRIGARRVSGELDEALRAVSSPHRIRLHNPYEGSQSRNRSTTRRQVLASAHACRSPARPSSESSETTRATSPRKSSVDSATSNRSP